MRPLGPQYESPNHTTAARGPARPEGFGDNLLRRSQALLLFALFSTGLMALELGRPLLDFIGQRFGQPAVERLLAWQALSQRSDFDGPLHKLTEVNRFFNQTPFLSDPQHWGREDYWASPVELLASNGGDCEDYSIAKYFTLLELGIPDERLKITYVKALELNQAHMVLAYYDSPDAEPLILDNLKSEVLPASARTDLLPVYSFNGEGLWLAKMRDRDGRRIGDADRLDSWQDLLRRHEIILGNGQ
jgi:predicted transglutaminase-like cysteine proteinase